MFTRFFTVFLLCVSFTNTAFAADGSSRATKTDIARRIRDYQENFKVWGAEDSEPVYVCPDSLHFSEGLAICRSKVTPNLYGYINAKHELVIGQQFYIAGPFQEELAVVAKVQTTSHKDGVTSFAPTTWGYIDHSGKYQIKLKNQITEAQNFSEGFAAAAIENPKGPGRRWGYIDKSGQFVIPPRYTVAKEFKNGLARVANMDPETGRVVWGYINNKGTELLSPQFVKADELHEGFARVAVVNSKSRLPQSMLWGYVNSAGQLQIKPQFTNADIFSQGVACVSIADQGSNKFGFIDQTGHFVIKPRCISAGRFSEGLAEAVFPTSKETVRGFIDKSGTFVMTWRDSSITAAQPFSEGLAAVQKNGKWGYIDKRGHTIIPPTFNQLAFPFHGSVAMAGNLVTPKQPLFGFLMAQPHTEWFFIDRQGKRYPPPEHNTAYDWKYPAN